MQNTKTITVMLPLGFHFLICDPTGLNEVSLRVFLEFSHLRHLPQVVEADLSCSDHTRVHTGARVHTRAHTTPLKIFISYQLNWVSSREHLLS